MSATERPIALAMQRIAELAIALGEAPINRKPGLWKHKFTDERGNEWDIACNGHKEMIDDLPPINTYVCFNGWPWAIIDPFGGHMIGTGDACNETRFIEALEAEIRKTGAVPA